MWRSAPGCRVLASSGSRRARFSTCGERKHTATSRGSDTSAGTNRLPTAGDAESMRSKSCRWQVRGRVNDRTVEAPRNRGTHGTECSVDVRLQTHVIKETAKWQAQAR